MSDLQVAQQLRFNVLLRWFCRIGLVDPVPDDTTRVVFRRRLKASGVYEQLMDRVVKQAKARGLGRGGWVIVDGMKVVADVAISNQLELVLEGRQRVVRALQPVQLGRVAVDVCQRFETSHMERFQRDVPACPTDRAHRPCQHH